MPHISTNEPNQRFKSYRGLAVILPIVLMCALVLRYSVNVPFWDEWELTPIFQHLHAGHFFFADFWQQHNEHRLLFPTLALVGLAGITHWNLQVESFASLLVATCSFLLLMKMVSGSKRIMSKRESLLLFLLALIWFSPVQMENWLWGWQLEWFMNVLGVALVAYGIFRIKVRSLSHASLGLILAGGVLAQYSLGNGTLVWPIIIAIMLYKRLKITQTLATFITGLATTFLYYFHYVNPGEPSKTLALKEPLHFIEYFFGYLGRPLSFYHKPAMAIGLVLVAIFVSLNAYLFIRQRKAFDKNLPWLFLGLYALGSATITGVARLGFGVSEAFSSRYTTISSLLVVSVIMLCWNNRQVLGKLAGDKHKLIWPLVVLGVFGLVFIEAAWGVHAANTKHQQLLASEQCTHVAAPTPSCLLSAYPNQSIVSSRLAYIKSIHWGGY